MTFLEPLLLWGLPLAAVPIVIHLLNLRRHRKVDWGAMQFLLQATRRRKGHTRLRHFLILAARMLAVLALIFVVSRPMSGRWFGWLSGRPDTILVLLDRSASMSQQNVQSNRSKRQLALEQLAGAIQQAGMPQHLVLIESRQRKPQPLESPAALLELPATSATDASADLPAMLQAAWEYMVANKSGRTDIWICSDLQAADWNAESGIWNQIRSGFLEQQQTVQFHLLSYDQVDPENRAVRVVKLQRHRGPEHDQLIMTLQITQQPSAPSGTVPVGIVVDGARTVVDLEVTGELAELVDHAVTIDRQRPQGWGKVELPSDGNPRDNVFYFRYGDTVQSRALIVSDQPGASWAFRLAVAPPSDTGTSAAPIIPPSEFALANLDEQTLIVWQTALPSGDAKSRLEQFVNRGGRLLMVPDMSKSDDAFLGYRWGEWSRPADEMPLAVEHWRNDGGLLRHSDAGEPLPVNLLQVTQHRQLIPSEPTANPATAGASTNGALLDAASGQVPARLVGGDPLLLNVPTDHGMVVWLTTLPQEPFSNLAQQGITFFVAMQRLLSEGTQQQAKRQFGEIDPADEVSGNLQTVDAWPEGGFSTEQPHVAGIYDREGQLLARNRPRAEDTTGVLTTDDLATLFAGLNYRVVSESLSGQRSLITEIWRVFVILLLLALLAECALCLPDVRPKQWVPA